MKKLLFALFIVVLLLAVSCKADPYLYKYDKTSYLGSWEIDFAPIEGDVDGCIQLVQFEFKSDFTYGVVEYLKNAQTNEIQVVEGAEGVYEYFFDEDTGIGTLSLDGGVTEYYWVEGEGLSTLILGKQYKFNRPKYIIRKADDQKDIVGLWEYRQDDRDTGGIFIEQVEIRSDGILDFYFISGVMEPMHENITVSWQYKLVDEELPYSRTHSENWIYGSEIYESAIPSSIGEPLHEKVNVITRYSYETVVDNGLSFTVDLGTVSSAYTIYQYGDRKLLQIFGDTYEKVSSKIDTSVKYKEIVNEWNDDDGVLDNDDLYLRADGTYSTSIDDVIEYSTQNDAGYYVGKYTSDYKEVTTDEAVAFEEMRYKDENPGDVPVGGWDAWRAEQAALIEADKANNDIKLLIGTITFTPQFGFERKSSVFIYVSTPKYGDEDLYGEPVTTSYLAIRNVNNEGDVTYWDFLR